MTHKHTQATRNHPLPPNLARPSSTNPLMVDDVYQTTTGSTHNYKVVEDDTLLHPVYRKAPGSWKVNYTLDAVSKVIVIMDNVWLKFCG